MKGIKILLALAVFFVLVGTASAAVNNASVTVGAESSYNSAVGAGNASVTAGGTSQVDVQSTQSTGRWAGFYGSITGSIVLADATSHWFKNWTVSNVAGAYVYASNASNPDFSTLAAATSTDEPSWLTTTGAADNFQNTFAQSEAQTFNGQSVTANYTQTYDNTGAETFKTYALKDGSSDLIWAALAQNDATGYNGNTVDYQLLVPVDGATATNYYFFLELP